MMDVTSFISTLEVFARQDLINYTMMKMGGCTKHLEIDPFSTKMKVRIKENTTYIEHELIYDPDMDWIIYQCKKPKYITDYGEHDNVLQKTYFKQVSTKEHQYVTPQIVELIKQLHEHIMISILIRVRNG